jgi:hypothetical protein
MGLRHLDIGLDFGLLVMPLAANSECRRPSRLCLQLYNVRGMRLGCCAVSATVSRSPSRGLSGSAIAQAAYAVAVPAATEMLTSGTYDSVAGGIAYDAMNEAITAAP